MHTKGIYTIVDLCRKGCSAFDDAGKDCFDLYVGDLHPGNIWGHQDVQKFTSTASMDDQPDRRDPDQIFQSVTLSWNWANQSLPYPRNAECQAN